MDPPPLSLASKCPVVDGRGVACLPLTWLDIFLEKCLGSNAKVYSSLQPQSVDHLHPPQRLPERAAEWTNHALPSPMAFGWSWEWDQADVSHVYATRSIWVCWSGCSSSSAGGWLLTEVGSLLVCPLQSLPPKLPFLCQKFVHGRPLLNRFLSEYLGDQGSVVFPRPLYLCPRPPKFTP